MSFSTALLRTHEVLGPMDNDKFRIIVEEVENVIAVGILKPAYIFKENLVEDHQRPQRALEQSEKVPTSQPPSMYIIVLRNFFLTCQMTHHMTCQKRHMTTDEKADNFLT